MSKSDVEFTIGADSSAFMVAPGKVHGGLNAVGQAYIGLQGVAATLQTAFTAMMGPVREFEAPGIRVYRRAELGKRYW